MAAPPYRTATEPTLHAHALTKRFKHTVALDGVDLDLHRGEVVAVLGPNGAGKSTFVRLVATLLRPDAGTLRVCGVDAVERPADVRRLIGLAGQSAAVEATLTGRENLQLVGRLFGLNRSDARYNADAVLALLGLTDAADQATKTYSGGMRRRLDLGASLVGAPRLLLLDEPTTGLDPRSRLELWNAIGALVAAGTDILLTTQYLEEADHLADRVVIIDRGRVIADAGPAELKRRVGHDVIEAHPIDSSRLAAAAAALDGLGVGTALADREGGRVLLSVEQGARHLSAAVRCLDAAAIEVSELGVRRPTLDEVFLALTSASGGGDVR